jgi:predicted phage terminase large subunit-like protein
VLEVVTAHLDSPATEKEINRQRLYWKARINLIEDKANGSAVIANMRKKVPGIVAVNPQGGKVSRMYAICGEWQTHNWYVSRTAAWTGPYIQHMCKFPAVLHDDDVDMTTQAGVYLQARGFRNGLVDWIKQQEVDAVAKRNGTYRPPENRPKPGDDLAVAKVTEPRMAKVVVGDDTLSCQNIVDGEICGCVLMQRISGGWRCAQCGHQRPLNANAPPPDLGQFRKTGWPVQR